MKLSAGYEAEQKELIIKVETDESRLSTLNQKTVDLRLLFNTIQQCTEITELDKTLVNKLIQRIEIHNNDKSSGHCRVEVDIYFTGVGMIDIPTEKELLSLMEEIRNQESKNILCSA